MKDSTLGASAAETVHAHDLSDVQSDVALQPGQKICCTCGKDVAHEERFKDKKGRYWCYDCGIADSHRRHGTETVKCPDCAESFAPDDLVEYEGHHFCAGCAKKRAVATRRQAAREAAAREAEARAARQWRWMIGGSVAFALAAIAFVIWRVFA